MNYLLAFAFGAVITGCLAMLITRGNGTETKRTTSSRSSPGVVGCRTVADLIALSDVELEQVDIVEMNIAVAREIPDLEGLDYGRYRRIIDGWTDQFSRWLSTAEHTFHQDPGYYKNDINFFRLGMLAQFLDQQIGIAYVAEQKQAQLEARKTGRKIEAFYTNPGDLLLHGLIDTKRGTCATMPALNVAIGRRLGWPVGLACVKSHYVCRYDDGQRVYNIETTDTGRGAFAEGSDEDYMRKQGVSRKAVACGSDLRKLSAREMLGVFISGRGRHYADTDRIALAARDYALAHTLFPNGRKIYAALVGHLVDIGETLFARTEYGHPASLGVYIAGRYPLPVARRPRSAVPRVRRRDPIAEVERINAINRARMQRLMRAPTVSQPYQLPVPSVPQPRRPHQPR